MERQGDWMQTFSGKMFWPLDPRADEIDIEDIAHSLSNMCRYAGHCRNFYSVAEHSVLVSHVIAPEYALAGLLHDATEAYLVDVPRPVKPYLANYKEIEARLWDVMCDRFGLDADWSMEYAIKHADNAVLAAEQPILMPNPPRPWNIPADPADVRIACRGPYVAKQAFLSRFDQLTKGTIYARG